MHLEIRLLRYSVQTRDTLATDAPRDTLAADVLKTTSDKVIQKTAEATGDLIGNIIPNTITKVSGSSPQNDSETITNEHDKEIPKERYISPEERQNYW